MKLYLSKNIFVFGLVALLSFHIKASGSEGLHIEADDGIEDFIDGMIAGGPAIYPQMPYDDQFDALGLHHPVDIVPFDTFLDTHGDLPVDDFLTNFMDVAEVTDEIRLVGQLAYWVAIYGHATFEVPEHSVGSLLTRHCVNHMAMMASLEIDFTAENFERFRQFVVAVLPHLTVEGVEPDDYLPIEVLANISLEVAGGDGILFGRDSAEFAAMYRNAILTVGAEEMEESLWTRLVALHPVLGGDHEEEPEDLFEFAAGYLLDLMIQPYGLIYGQNGYEIDVDEDVVLPGLMGFINAGGGDDIEDGAGGSAAAA